MAIAYQLYALMEPIQTCVASVRFRIVDRMSCAMVMAYVNFYNVVVNKALKLSVGNVLKSVKLIQCAMTMVVAASLSQIAHKASA